MGELEDFVGCTIRRDLTKITLNISHIIDKKKQGLKKGVKSLMTINTPVAPNLGIVRNK